VLQAKFPQCVEQNRGAQHTFTPHLTLGSVARNTKELQVVDFIRRYLPLRGSVGELSVLHRPDERFFVAHRVPLGQAVTTTSEQPPRRRGEVLEAVVGEFQVPCQLELFGSARYAPGFESDEVDAVLMFEAERDVEQVVVALESALGRRGVQTRRASPTLLRATGYDVQVVQLPHSAQPRPVGAWVEALPDGALRRALLGPLDADALRAALELHGRAAAFDELFPLVRRWSKARGLEGNAFGYFGGLGWAVLTAAPLLHDAHLCAHASWPLWCRWASQLEPSALVALDWSASLPGAGLRVCSPSRPFRDLGRSLTPTTQAVLLHEFAGLGDGQTFEDVQQTLGAQLVFSGGDEASLGRFQQRFLALCTALEPSVQLRPVGRVERGPTGWQVLLGVSSPPAASLVADALRALSLEAKVTASP
jgi:hypothetical protein